MSEVCVTARELTASPRAELIKQSSRHLRGSILEELTLERPDFTAETVQILKFHGATQQTDRDARRNRLPAEYGSMVRVAIPGGALSAEQYLKIDRLACELGDGGLRITTRQDIQFHRVKKCNLRPAIRALNESLMTTLAACGDVVRNVVCCPAPFGGPERRYIQGLAVQLAAELRPRTRAYYEIWLDGEKAASTEPVSDEEPLYGPAYLPRKFKIGLAAMGDNCIDIYTNDLGIVPGRSGFTLLVGGGLGMSAGVRASHPRLAEPLGSVATEQLSAAVRAIVGIHRDFGNRANRKLARLRYVLDEWGIERFRTEFESRLGARVGPPEALHWSSASDHLGWHTQNDGSLFLGLPVPSGRIRGALRTALRELVRRLRPGVRLTAQQNLLLTDLTAGHRSDAMRMLAAGGIRVAEELPPVLREALACVALPTCGQAITEAERVLPEIAGAIHHEMAALGIGGETISIRVTGCPNGCARPYTSEIGIVGRSAAQYSIYLGGSHLGIRLGSVFAENVPRDEIARRLRPVLRAYARQRRPNESFGDFCARVDPGSSCAGYIR